MQFFCWQFVVKTMSCQQFNEQSLSSASPPQPPQKVMHRGKVVEYPPPPPPPSQQVLRYGPDQWRWSSWNQSLKTSTLFPLLNLTNLKSSILFLEQHVFVSLENKQFPLWDQVVQVWPVSSTRYHSWGGTWKNQHAWLFCWRDIQHRLLEFCAPLLNELESETK